LNKALKIMTESKSSIAQQLGKAGGSKTLKKYGKKHFKEIAKKRWDKEKKQKDEPDEVQF